METILKNPTTDDLSHVLKGLKVFVDVRNEKENWSFVYENLLKELGAKVVSKISENPTHVVFHNGYHRTLNAAKRRNVHLVAVRWVESCKIEGKRVPEEDYPAVMLPAPKEDTFWKLFRKYKILDKMKREREEKRLQMANDLMVSDGSKERSNNIKDEEELYEEFANKLMNINNINDNKINDQSDNKNKNNIKTEMDDDIRDDESNKSDDDYKMGENGSPKNKIENETPESHNDLIKKENELLLTPSDENSLVSSQTYSSSQGNNITDDNDDINDGLNYSNTTLSAPRFDDEIDLGDNELMNSFKTPLLERCLARMTDLPAKNIEHIRNYITSPMYRMRQMQELDKYKIPQEQPPSLEHNKRKVKRRKSHFGAKSLVNSNSASGKAKNKRISTLNRSIASYFNTPTSSSSSTKQSSTPLRTTKPPLTAHNQRHHHEDLPRRNLFDSFRDKINCEDNNQENILDVLCKSQDSNNNNQNDINKANNNNNGSIKNEKYTPQKKKRAVENVYEDVHKKIKLEIDDNFDISNENGNNSAEENFEGNESISDILDDIKLNSVDEFLSLIQADDNGKNKNAAGNIDKETSKHSDHINNDRGNSLITKKKRKLLNPQSLLLSHLPSSTNTSKSISKNSFDYSNRNSIFESFTTSSHNSSLRSERFKPLNFVASSNLHKKLINNNLNNSDINRSNSKFASHTNTTTCLNKKFYSAKPIYLSFSHTKTTIASQEKTQKSESSFNNAQKSLKSDFHSHNNSPLQALVSHSPTKQNPPSDTLVSNQLRMKKIFFQPPFKFSSKSSSALESSNQVKGPSLTVSIPLPPSLVPSSSSFSSQLSLPSQPLSLDFPSPSSQLSSRVGIDKANNTSINNTVNITRNNDKLCLNGTLTVVATSLNKDQKEVLKEATAKMGGVKNFDVVDGAGVVLVMGEKLRTVKLLRAVCYGCWVVKFDWVLESMKHGAWLRFDDYEADDYYPVVRINRLKRLEAESSDILAEICGEDVKKDFLNDPQKNLLTTSESCINKTINSLPTCLIFSSCGPIYIDSCCKPDKGDLESIVSLCGGKVVMNVRKATICVGKVVKKYLLNVKETWIVESLMEGRCLDHKSFLLN